MRVISLEAEAFKRLKAISIRPSGNLVEITGDNGNGKTSVLDAIWAAVGGKEACPAKPIHTGETEAEVRLVLGDGGEPKYQVTRRFKLKEGVPYSTDVIVELAEGGRLSSGQTLLASLVGDLCFDPLAFTRKDDEEQIKTLRKFVPQVDFAKIEALNKADYEARTEVNRTAKQLRAQIASLPVAPPDAPAPERVDIAALEAELGSASTHNAERERVLASRQRDADAITSRRERIALLRVQIEQLEDECATIQGRADGAPKPPEPIDVSDVQQRLSFGRMANAAADVADRRQALEQEATQAEAVSDKLTASIERRKAEAATAVQKANMPVPGLGFGDGVVTLNGEPFAQASQAEKIRASVAIAAAMNPKLRVARIADGSLLDRNSWAALEEYAKEADLQIWIETVEAKGKAAILIQDGGVAADEDPGDIL